MCIGTNLEIMEGRGETREMTTKTDRKDEKGDRKYREKIVYFRVRLIKSNE